MAKPSPIAIPTEPIGSIPRAADLIDRVAKGDAGFRRILVLRIDPHIETPEEARGALGRITAGDTRTVYF
jgi:hypothetical protein